MVVVVVGVELHTSATGRQNDRARRHLRRVLLGRQVKRTCSTSSCRALSRRLLTERMKSRWLVVDGVERAASKCKKGRKFGKGTNSGLHLPKFSRMCAALAAFGTGLQSHLLATSVSRLILGSGGVPAVSSLDFQVNLSAFLNFILFRYASVDYFEPTKKLREFTRKVILRILFCTEIWTNLLWNNSSSSAKT